MEGTTLREVADSFRDTYNNVVNGNLEPKAAQEANRALNGIVAVHKTQLSWLTKAEVGHNVVKQEAMRILGMIEKKPEIEKAL
jgi:hypothetical protein